MHIEKHDRGFEVLVHDAYANHPAPERLAQQSSAIGDYPDAWDRPGTSFLWIGAQHHLSREQVAEFVGYLKAWLETGHLEKQA